jgi:Condensation domain/AMP-binding enzyme/Phosphopantetheine attachment site
LVGYYNIYNTYGPTETTVTATMKKVDKDYIAGNIGQAASTKQVLVINDCDQEIPPGIIGEICIGGDEVALGYINQPKLTASRFVKIDMRNEIIFYKSGDRGYKLNNGDIVFVGRRDTQLKIGGYRVDTAGIENMMLQHPGINISKVIDHQNKDGNKVLIAYYSCNSALIQENDIRKFILSKIPPQTCPTRFIFLHQWPQGSNGKTDVKKLRSMASSVEVVEGRLQDDIEKTIAQVWQEILGKVVDNFNCNFFYLGGQSISALKMIARLSSIFSINLRIADIYANPVLKDLCLLIRDRRSHDTLTVFKTTDEINYELSKAQLGLWLLHHLGEHTGAFNIFGAYEFIGPLNLEVVDLTFDHLLKRHESLRTRFIVKNDTPYQVAEEDVKLYISYVDLRTAKEKEVDIKQFAKQQNETEFNLQKAPLVRVSILQTGDEQFLLLLTAHHLIFDGWSNQILAKEFFKLYSMATQSGTLPSLPRPHSRYVDYVTSQREFINSDEYKNQEAFWKKYLSGASAFIKFPVDIADPVLGTKANTIDSDLSPLIYERLSIFFMQSGVTFFSGMLGVISLLLHKLSGMKDIAILCPFSSRVSNGWMNVIGMFVNPLVLRFEINDASTFRDHLTAVNESLQSAISNCNYPFEDVMTLLRSAAPGRQATNFNVKVLFDDGEIQVNNFDRVIEVDKGLFFKQYPLYSGVTAHDLTLIISRQETLKISIQYRISIWKPESIELMMVKLRIIIEELMNNQGGIIKELILDRKLDAIRAPALSDLFSGNESF